MGVFKNLIRYSLGRAASKKHPHATGTAYVMIGKISDELKKEEKEEKKNYNYETSGKSALIFIIVCSMLLVIAAIGSALDKGKDTKSKTTENVETRKVYKTDSKEYFKLLNDTANEVANKYSDIYLLRTNTSGATYYHIILYSHKHINEEDYEKIKTSYMNDLKDKLSNYKFKASFLNNYEIVQVYFYNLQDHSPYNRERFDWVQFYTTDLN